jgi:uncharacterized repeat protein (TIGR03803 family)
MNCRRFLGAASAAVMIVIVITLMLTPGAWAAGHFKTLHMFTGGADGSQPAAELIFDAAGNLYGTTEGGGAYGYGTVFKLDTTGAETVLYSFTGGNDGWGPAAGLIFDQAGSLYGTTTWGGGPAQFGVVFQLTPNADGSWTESVLHQFTDKKYGANPAAGIIFDQAGNLYGTTVRGGVHEWGKQGMVFQLTPNLDGSWTENVVDLFIDPNDGRTPRASLIFDRAGNLYGTTYSGGIIKCCFVHGGFGVVFELTPNPNGSWTESVLHSFRDGRDGASLAGGVVFDGAGNLYGTAYQGGAYGGGVVFRLTPNPDGSWSDKTLHKFYSGANSDGVNPNAGLVLDAAGNLYGTTNSGGRSKGCNGSGCGVVFTLKSQPRQITNQMKVLHRFTGKDGANPAARLILDAAGNLYGTTQSGGEGYGVVFEITP